MLTKLKRKFILINMILVGVVLIAVFTIVCVNTYKEQMSDLNVSLSRAMRLAQNIEGRPTLNKDDNDSTFHNDYGPGNSIDTQSVAYYYDGNYITKLESDHLELSDSKLKKAVHTAVNSGKSLGEIQGMDLYFMKIDSTYSATISFADSETVNERISGAILISIILCAGSLVVLFFISLLLASMAVRPVQKTWDQQQQFVADASHELKTPLTVMLANNNILLDHRNETVEAQKKWIESSQAEANHMKKLIDNLLFLARSDASKNKLIFSVVPLSDIIMDTFLQFEPIAFESGIETISEIDPDISMVGDQTQLKQLIHILIDNACKYAGDNGKVKVVLKKSDHSHHIRGRNTSEITLAVNNTGKPIDSKDIPHIFERFYRADKARVQGEGYGLGLSIAKRIVEEHKGKITVTSSAQSGTTFTVIFR